MDRMQDIRKHHGEGPFDPPTFRKPPPETLMESLEDLRGAWYWFWEAVKVALRRK